MLKIFENWKKLKWKLGKSQFSKVENWKNLIWPLGTGAETAKHDFKIKIDLFKKWKRKHTVLLDVKATFNLMRNWNRFSA